MRNALKHLASVNLPKCPAVILDAPWNGCDGIAGSQMDDIVDYVLWEQGVLTLSEITQRVISRSICVDGYGVGKSLTRLIKKGRVKRVLSGIYRHQQSPML